MKMSKAFPSTYLKSSDLDGDVVLTISSVEMEELGQGRNKEEKPVVYFEEHDKGCVLNKTNAAVLAGAYGDDTDDWIGERITLFEKEVEYAGDLVTGIRMKLPSRKKPATNEKARKKPADDDDDERPALVKKKRKPSDDDEIPF